MNGWYHEPQRYMFDLNSGAEAVVVENVEGGWDWHAFGPNEYIAGCTLYKKPVLGHGHTDELAAAKRAARVALRQAARA